MVLSNKTHHHGGDPRRHSEIDGLNTRDVYTLPEYWRAKSVRLQPYSPAAANAFNEAAKDLAATLENRDSEVLSVSDAAAESGYSSEYLARLVREGTIPNAGRHGAPRIRRGDLPYRKNYQVVRQQSSSYDPGADAQKLLSRRSGGV